MFRFMSSVSAVSLPRSNSSGVYYHSSHFRRKCSEVNICNSVLSSSGGSRGYNSRTLNRTFLKQKGSSHPLKIASSSTSTGRQLRLGLWSRCRSMSLRLPMPAHERGWRFNWNVKRTPWTVGGASLGVCLSFSTSGRVYADASMGNNNENNGNHASSFSSTHGKKVHTDYSITGIPGDGRCLFRSVAHGACIRSGKPFPDETLQRELADELRERVADEFVKRRAETEWFVEGDFDAYVSLIRKPHVWGGEPELFMASHVLQMPITVYMHDEDSGGLIAIAEYGQEYGKEDPIQVLYHGFGHYDSLHIPGKKGAKPRL